MIEKYSIKYNATMTSHINALTLIMLHLLGMSISAKFVEIGDGICANGAFFV